jgi:hypothetical protein
MTIHGAQDWPPDQLTRELAAGGRLVRYELCVSLIFTTFRRESAIYFVPAGHSGFWSGLPYTLVSLLLGWWGLPWGVLYTPVCVFTNLTGGRDVTACQPTASTL